MGLADVVGYDVETGGKPWDPMGLGELSTKSKLGEPHLEVSSSSSSSSSSRSRRSRRRKRKRKEGVCVRVKSL